MAQPIHQNTASLRRLPILLVAIVMMANLYGCASINHAIDEMQGQLSDPSGVAVSATDVTEDLTLNLDDKNDLEKAIDNKLSRSQTLTRGGITYLMDGKYQQASDVFNTALSFDVDNALLHFFNAYTYHQLFLRGDSTHFPLAELGYKAAAAKESALRGPAYGQLGELYLDEKKYALAEEYLSLAIQKNRRPELLYNYARATGLNGSWEKSRAAIAELDRKGWSNPQLIKAKAILAAASANPKETKSLLELYAKSTSSKADISYVNFRINQINDNLTKGFVLALNDEDPPVALDTDPLPTPPPGPDPSLTDAAPTTANDAAPTTANDAAPTTANDAEPTTANDAEPTTANDAEPTTANDAKDTKKIDPPKNVGKWYRCDPETKISEAMANDATTTDEFILAPTLPQSCPGENPMSAVIEITMIETYEATTNTSGINMLDGLNAILTIGGSNAVTSVSGSSTDTKTRDNTWLLANASSTSSVTYSLNIVNSGLNQAKLLSRPAMTVIDRVPSVFFAGSNISLGIAGDAYTAPTVVDKTIGVSLSVTPTFVDEDNVLISMRTSNAGISSALTNIPDALLQQTRNSMRSSAIMKFDETIVLNGIRQESAGIINSGVPILKDLPLLQYLFKNNTESATSLNYITFLTLRRPTPPKKADSSVENIIPELKNYISFTEKDFDVVTHQPEDKLAELLNDLKRLVYF
jgi:tetratricopeptide (TPR) repeat protein